MHSQGSRTRNAHCVATIAKLSLPLALSAACLPVFADSFDYCVFPDNVHKTVYFSELFARRAAQWPQEVGAFNDHVHANYSNVAGAGDCKSTLMDDLRMARQKVDEERAMYRNQGFNVVDMRWTY